MSKRPTAMKIFQRLGMRVCIPGRIRSGNVALCAYADPDERARRGTDGDVGEVEHRQGPPAELHEVDHVAEAQAVDEGGRPSASLLVS